jgi:hypothetical protein
MHWSPLALAFLGTVTASANASCPVDPPSVAGVLATERRWVAAIETRDINLLDCILDPTFADTSWRGELVSRAQVLSRLPARPPSTLKLSDLRATLIGNVAIVRGVNTQSDGAKSIGSVRFVDLFVYRAHRWRAVSAQESLIQP